MSKAKEKENFDPYAIGNQIDENGYSKVTPEEAAKHARVKESLSIEPLYDRIIVRRDGITKEVTSGGIIIPEVAKEKPNKGTVVAVGSGRLMQDGSVFPMTVKVGDRVLFSRYAGSKVSFSDKDYDEEYLLCREDEILARFKT